MNEAQAQYLIDVIEVYISSKISAQHYCDISDNPEFVLEEQNRAFGKYKMFTDQANLSRIKLKEILVNL